MRYFIDTEFNERGYEHRIELISIALVCEDGREFYAIAKDGWDPENCDGWLHENVLPYLYPKGLDVKPTPRSQIATELRSFILENPKPEFIGYFADYDWVLFCQLFGRMVDLPKHFPKYCLDIKQMMEDKHLTKKDLPKQEEQEHNALADARHMKRMYEAIVGKH
jgi:hypothetical protein